MYGAVKGMLRKSIISIGDAKKIVQNGRKPPSSKATRVIP